MAATSQKQVAALAWRRHKGRIEVLMVTSRKHAHWILPKGHRMHDRRQSAAAEQEALEEGGVTGRVRRKALGSYVHGKRAKACLKVRVFPLRVQRVHGRWPECDERDRRWLSLAKAAQAPHSSDLARLLANVDVEDLT
jgi:8-oxo-dGTP pyrophosphatase MutT (NUDIX family)